MSSISCKSPAPYTVGILSKGVAGLLRGGNGLQGLHSRLPGNRAAPSQGFRNRGRAPRLHRGDFARLRCRFAKDKKAQSALGVVFKSVQRGKKAVLVDYASSYLQAIQYLESQDAKIHSELQVKLFVRGLTRRLRRSAKKELALSPCTEGVQEAMKRVWALDKRLKEETEAEMEKRGVRFISRDLPGRGLRHRDEVERIIKHGCCFDCLLQDHRKGDLECIYHAPAHLRFRVGV